MTATKVLLAMVGLLVAAVSPGLGAAVLPEDRVDLMHHSYEGGGVSVQGPSILVRKSIKNKVSLHGSYRVDTISSASIDVLSQGSPYSEQRTEYSLGADYLVDQAVLSASFTNSTEDDYIADTFSLGVSQSFFGEMTTVSMGYAQGSDTILRNDDPDFEEYAERRRFNLSLSQILTRNWIVAVNAESVVDEGYLNNPYRSVRYLEGDGSEGWQREYYKTARNSEAVALRSVYYLPYRAALRLEARVFGDSWGIKARNYELRYVHPLAENFILELKTRFYRQNEADFYADVFAYPVPYGTEYRARDKELSAFDSVNFGFGFTYEMDLGLAFTSKQSVNLFWDFMRFDYDNFRNPLLSRVQNGRIPAFDPGEEPNYHFEASILRVFLSAYF